MDMILTTTGFSCKFVAESASSEIEVYSFNHYEQDVADLYDWVKSNRNVLLPTIAILGTGLVVGSAISAGMTAAGLPRVDVSSYLGIPSITDIAGFLDIKEPKAIEAMAHMDAMLDPYKKSDAFQGQNSGRLLLDILVIGCFGGIISAVLSAAGQKNIAILIGFVATMIIILKVVDLVNSVIDHISKFLGF